jgi:hypothetical protein
VVVKVRKTKSFKQLVTENKQALLNNNKELANIDKKVDEKISNKQFS